MKNTQVLSCFFVILLTIQTVSGKGIYVSDNGSDKNSGSIQEPYRTLEFAVKFLESGDTLFIREGVYKIPMNINNLNGDKENPIVITGYKDEKVVLDGTRQVTGEWKLFKGNIFVRQLDFKGSQLFFDNKLMTTARFPNALWSDGTIFENHLACRHLAPESTPGVMYDEDPPLSKDYDTYDEGAEQSGNYSTVNSTSIGESGINFTGATVVLHLGSWLSWAQEVKEHIEGEDIFTYHMDFSRSGKQAKSAEKYINNKKFFYQKNIKTGQGYYFFEGLMCLDAEEEWWFDNETNNLYFYAPDGVNPTGKNIKLKINDYNLQVTNSEFVVIKNLDFFGTTFSVENSHNITVENIDVLYPSYNKIVFNDFRRPNVTSLVASKDEETNYIVRNCTFRYADGPGIELRGKGNLVENCLFHHIDYTCLGSGGEGTVNIGSDVTFRRNTIYTAGNSEGIRPSRNALIELNHVYDMSKIQHDGSLINVGVAAQDNTIVRKNWSHDTYKSAYRFDSSNMGDSTTVNYGVNGTMAFNVLWNIGPMKVKGENHKIYNNTAYKPNGKGEIGIAVLDNPNMGGFNDKTIVANNMGKLSGHFTREKAPAGILKGNFDTDLNEILRDPKNLDFRPIEAEASWPEGKAISEIEKTDDKRVFVGAYEPGEDEYWIPGYQSEKASTPVPCNNCSAVKINADLMWLQGYMATEHHVYLGESLEKVSNANTLSEEFIGTFENNIVTPDNLLPGKRYYWRVDAKKDGKYIKGTIWSFEVE